MSSAAGIRRSIPFTFLNRQQAQTHLSIRNPKALALVLIVLLLSVQLLPLAVSPDSRTPIDDGIPARAALVTISSFTISPLVVYVGQPVYFFANASSDVGTNLTFTIYYDYVLADGFTPNPQSPISVNNTDNPGSIVQTHVYSTPGNCTGSTLQVALFVYDGETTKRSVKYVTVLEGNLAPYFSPSLGNTYPAQIGVPLEFSVTVWDDDNDAVNLTWSFGDGSPVVVQSTGPASGGMVCTQSHAWNPPPELVYGVGDTNINYYLNLSLEDGQGNYLNTTTLIYISLPHNFSPQGSITASSSVVDPADTVTFYATATDVEGEPLTWTFLFSNSSEVYQTEVYQTPLSVPNTILFLNITHIFTEPGNYTVDFHLSDVWLPEDQTGSHNVSVGTVHLSSIENRVPVVLDYIMVFPQDVLINETTGVAQVLLRIQANDYDGEVLTATWDFGDGTPAAMNVTQGGTQVYTIDQVHEFTASGQYNVSVVVTDGREGHEVLRHKLVNVTSNNSSPQVVDFDVILSHSSYGLPGSVVQFIIVLFDNERNPLTVSWDFGDGSPIEWTNTTVFNESGHAVCMINHTYSEEGDYTVLVNFTDGLYGLIGLHEDSWSGLVVIGVGSEDTVRVWDWWDYTSLTLFMVCIGLLFLWSVSGVIRRRRLDRMGVSVEEYLLRKQELDQYEEKRKGREGLR